ncbi:MAG: asparaginase [Chloroflexota bacterium]
MSETLVHVTRGDLVECIHNGDVAVVDETGKLLYSLGDPERVSYLRSSAKPAQALPIVESGAIDHFRMSDRELAVMCASHNAETIHTETVLGILRKIGLSEAALQCGVHAPYDAEANEQLVLAGRKPSSVHCNCSGKHSGMLTLAQMMGWPVEGYFKPEHPVQRAAKAAVANMADYPEDRIVVGTDGCGVPVFGMPVRNMAVIFAQLAKPDRLPDKRRQAVHRIVKAMTTEPQMVAGRNRLDTDLMKACRGKIVAKGGAEGVLCVGVVGEGIGIAIKCDDGSGRPHSVVITSILKQLGYLDPEAERELAQWVRPEVRNHRNEVCGRIVPAFELRKH